MHLVVLVPQYRLHRLYLLCAGRVLGGPWIRWEKGIFGLRPVGVGSQRGLGDGRRYLVLAEDLKVPKARLPAWLCWRSRKHERRDGEKQAGLRGAPR
jgi:hypothetical protein